MSHTTHLSHTHITKLISYTTHLTHNSSHTQLISHTSSHRRVAWQAQYSEPPEGAAPRIVAGWAAALLCVAGAVHRGFWRSWGADCRRLGRGFSLREAQYTEPPEGAGARIVAGWAAPSLCVAGAVHRAFWRSCGADCRRLGRGSPLRGRSLLKELGRGLSPAGPRLLSAWQAQYSEPPEGAAPRIVAGWAAALLCVAGAVHRGFWRSWGADCRRLGRGFSLREAQYTEPPEGAGARIVAGWAAPSLCVAGAVHRAFEGAAARIVAGWAAALLCVAGAVHRASWRSWDADCRRLGRAFSLRGRRSTQRLLKELRRGLSPAGPRLSFARQAQYTEPPEGAAARIVAGWAAASLCLAGAVHRAFWRSCGADCRRLGRGSPLRGRRSIQSLLKELRRGLSPAGPRLSFAWQAQYSEPPEGAAARIVAGWAVLSFAWQAQYTEPSEGAGARIVAGWAAAFLCAAGAVHRAFWRSCGADCRRLGRGWLVAAVILAFAEEVSVWQICVAAVSPQLYWRLQRRCLCDRSVSPPLYWRLQRRCLCDRSVLPQFYWRLQRRCLCDRSVLPQLYWRLQRRCLCDRPASPQLYWRFSHNSSHKAHPTPLISHPSSHTTHLTPLISHHSSHTTHPTPLVHTTHLTPLISHHSSHTIHLTHNSSHTTHLTPLISHHSIPHPSSHTTHLTPLISHHSSHTTHPTPLISLITHTTHLTPPISHNSSHTTHLTHNSSHTQLISHTTHLTQLIPHHSSHTPHRTQLISHH